MAEAKSSVVDSFLEQIDLQKYCKSFHSQRYETAIDLYLIEDSDLDSLGIDPNDRAKLLAAGRLKLSIELIGHVLILLIKHNIFIFIIYDDERYSGRLLRLHQKQDSFRSNSCSVFLILLSIITNLIELSK